MKAPVTIFLSHAKAISTRGTTRIPVRQTRQALNELPVEQWYDAQQIATSQDFADAISAGIAYGGALKGTLSGTSNFTLRLFELVRTYSKLAEGVNARPLQGAILNVAPWPLWLDYGESEWKLFSGDIADYEQAPRPDLPWSDDEVFPPGASARLRGSDTPERATPGRAA